MWAKRRSHLPRIEYFSNKEDGFLYYAAVLVTAGASWAVHLLPGRVTSRVAVAVSRLLFHTSRSYRSNVESNMSHVLGKPVESGSVALATSQVFQTIAFNCIDLLRSPHLSADELRSSIRLAEGKWSYLEDARSEGKGAIVLTAHLGAFDLVGSALVHYGYPMTVLTTRTTNRLAHNAVTFLRRSHGVKVLEASSGGVRSVIRELNNGNTIGLLSDRDFNHRGKPVTFFGSNTTLPIGAVRLSRDTGAPIVPIFTHRIGRINDLVIYPPFHVPATSDRHHDIKAGIEKMASVVEREIIRYPGQWVLFQRVWPEPVDGRHSSE